MLETIATVGSALSGASSFLGGLGFGKKEKKGPSMEEQLAAQRQHQMTFDLDRPSWIRAGAEKAGLHPLAVMGISPASGPSYSLEGGRSKGVDLEAMGQGIDRMANAGRTQVQRKLDELALEQAELSNDYLRVQIAGAQKAISRSGATIPLDSADTSGNASPLFVPRNRLVEVVKDQQTTKNPKDSGVTAGNHSGFMTIDLGNGRTAEVPKSDDWAESIGEMPWLYKWGKMTEIMGKRFGAKHQVRERVTEKKYSKKYLAPWDPRRWKK